MCVTKLSYTQLNLTLDVNLIECLTEIGLNNCSSTACYRFEIAPIYVSDALYVGDYVVLNAQSHPSHDQYKGDKINHSHDNNIEIIEQKHPKWLLA